MSTAPSVAQSTASRRVEPCHRIHRTRATSLSRRLDAVRRRRARNVPNGRRRAWARGVDQEPGVKAGGATHGGRRRAELRPAGRCGIAEVEVDLGGARVEEAIPGQNVPQLEAMTVPRAGKHARRRRRDCAEQSESVAEHGLESRHSTSTRRRPRVGVAKTISIGGRKRYPRASLIPAGFVAEMGSGPAVRPNLPAGPIFTPR